MYRFLLFYLAIFLFTACTSDAAPAPGTAEQASNEAYKRQDWLPQTTQDSLAQPVGVGLAPNGDIIILHRGLAQAAPYVPGNVVAFVDSQTGVLNAAWGAGFFIQPHGMHVDQNNNIWITDIKRHQVFKFSLTGELLLTLGEEGVSGSDSLHFDQPTDVAVSPDGHFFVTDGYGNRRIMKFTAEGSLVKTWGREGESPGEFKNPHAIDIGEDGTLYISDRENNRVQLFDGEGKYLKEISTAGAVYACIVTSESLLATDFLMEDTIVRGSAVFPLPITDERFLVGRPEVEGTSEPCRYHDLVLAADGSIYLADLLSNEVHRFTK